eukprot:3140857-Amphidinium_carterae.2
MLPSLKGISLETHVLVVPTNLDEDGDVSRQDDFLSVGHTKAVLEVAHAVNRGVGANNHWQRVWIQKLSM